MRSQMILGVSLFLAATCSAQDVAMGARRGTGARLEAPYTLEVKTPHVKWAKPLPGGPIRLLAVPTVREGRTVVELAQRLSLDLSTVTIDGAFDTNKWTMGFGRDYGARAEKGNLSLVYSYLEAELTSPKEFDAILLPMHHGWDKLTPASREALVRRVREGAGLILIRPMETELSPLHPAAPLPVPRAPYDVIEPESVEGGAWKRMADHYITRAVPVESFPSKYLQEYRYTAAPDANVLIQSAAGNPILAVRPFGTGRVVSLAYRNSGVSWFMPMSARYAVSNLQWEYFYSLLVRSVIWAASRESAAPANLDNGEWRLKSADGSVTYSGRGRPPKFDKLAPGTYFVERQAGAEWQIDAIDVAQPDFVRDLRVTSEVISEGIAVAAEWQSSVPGTAELLDGFGRVIASAKGTRQGAQLKPGRPLTHSGILRVTAGTATAHVEVRFAASSREWADYEVIMPWYGPGSHQPWMAALDEQFRRAGITTLSNPERDFKVIASAGLHDVFGVYAYRNQNYLKRKAAYLETKDKKYLTRDYVVQDPDFEPNLKRELSNRLGRLAPLKPLAYYVADESSLTSYTDAFDVDWAPAAIAGFRQWLQRHYGTLDKLNATWATQFKAWGEVLPMTTEEAQQHKNFAPWADHRAYMEESFVHALGRARDILREIDPGALASISGTQVPTAHNGANWYEINQRMDYLQPYSGGNQDAMHHLFRPGIKLTGFTGYGTTGIPAQYQQWQRLFYGHTGASIFWHYTILNPDLTLSEQGKALGEAFGRIQSGIGRIFMNSRVREDGVAIHFSMASIRGAWITDGKIMPGVGNVNRTSKNYADLVRRRDAWVKELERQGVQFRFLATPQIEAGALKQFKVLILPYSIALSEAEAREIEAFAERGGTVYLDDQTGRMDEHCRWLPQPRLREGPKGFVLRGPGEIGVPRPLDVPGSFLFTVRDFGSARLIGMLPEETGRVQLPPSKQVRYDLLRGGPAATTVEAGPDRPVLLMERANRIADLRISPALEISLTEAGGAAVDHSVVRVEVLDPAGRVMRHYSGNVSVVDGRAKFEVPFAKNDAAGDWTVRARDVVSGLTAERKLRRPVTP